MQMQITSKFTIAVHTITALDYFRDMDRVNSEFLAGSIGVNPVIVRNVLSQLRRAGIVNTRRGSSGATLARPLEEITLYDLYRAVGSVDEEEGLFHFHEQPNAACPVGRNIHKVMDARLAAVQQTMENELKKMTMADVVSEIRNVIDRENKDESSAGERISD